jgi:hypothetical protein
MGHTLLALPLVSQYLDMTRDLFLGPFYPGLFQVVDEELVALSASSPPLPRRSRLPVRSSL